MLKFFSEELLLASYAPYPPDTLIAEEGVAGTYRYEVVPGTYLIKLIGGGGGSAQTDGGTDAYSDTAWAWHYGHNGADGAIFEGYARIPKKGILTIVVGAVGSNRAGKGNTAGNGGDSYAIFTSTNGTAVELARAGGGHSGYPDGSSFGANVSGGTVTYNSNYITTVITAQNGAAGALVWSVKI